MNNRIRKIIYPTLAATLTAIGVSSCSLLEKTGISKSQDITASTDSVAPQSGASSVKPLAPPKNSAKKADKSPDKNRKNAKGVKNSKKAQKKKMAALKEQQEIAKATGEDTSRRENLTETTVIPAADGTEGAAKKLTQTPEVPTDFTINGEWTIYQVRGNLVGGEERPYVTFDLAAKRFYGSNGCNYVNGDLRLEGRFQIMLENLITTMKMCQDAEYEYLINLALSDVRSFAVRPEGSETYLDMKAASGDVIMTLRRHNMDFLNGAWRITELNGTPLNGPEDATITINIPDLKIHGSTGCNIFNGELFIDPDKSRSMQFASIVTTRMACPEEARQTELLLALEEVEHARSTGKDTVEMYGKEGRILLSLTKIDLNRDE